MNIIEKGISVSHFCGGDINNIISAVNVLKKALKKGDYELAEKMADAIKKSTLSISEIHQEVDNVNNLK